MNGILTIDWMRQLAIKIQKVKHCDFVSCTCVDFCVHVKPVFALAKPLHGLSVYTKC